MTHKLTDEIIAAAIEGLESQKEKIDLRISELRDMMSGHPVESRTTAAPKRGKRRKMSPAARARIAAAQKKRWLVFHNRQGHAAAPKAKPKRKLSPATKAKLIANLKKARAARAAKRAAA
jgi:hypothetical protein